jgi:hypothetical protein
MVSFGALVLISVLSVISIAIAGIVFLVPTSALEKNGKLLKGCALARDKCMRVTCPPGYVGCSCPVCDTKDPTQYYINIQYDTKKKSIFIDRGNSSINIYTIQPQQKNTIITFRYSIQYDNGTDPRPLPLNLDPVFSYNINTKTYKNNHQQTLPASYFDPVVGQALETYLNKN